MTAACSYQLFETLLETADTRTNDTIGLSFVVILWKRPIFVQKDLHVLSFKIIRQTSVFVPCMTQGPYSDVHYEMEHWLGVDSCLHSQANGRLISTHRY
jgi:hypothetical protein